MEGYTDDDTVMPLENTAKIIRYLRDKLSAVHSIPEIGRPVHMLPEGSQPPNVTISNNRYRARYNTM
jgi:hypothetical protein